jgi:hypothetical protein
LNKESSSRYQAIVLKSWTDDYESPYFEVGLVHLKNGDHRNGVVRALRVSPFHVRFIQLDEAFFEYVHSHLYNAQAQSFGARTPAEKTIAENEKLGRRSTTLSDEEARACRR